MIYVYAFFQTLATELVLPMGICRPTEQVGTAHLSALVEWGVPLAELKANNNLLIPAIIVHDQVIQALFQQTTVLPLQFGKAFALKETLLAELNEQQLRYQQVLQRLAGKAEYRIQFTPLEIPEIEIAESARGRNYFLAKKQQQQMQQTWKQSQQVELEHAIAAISQNFELKRMPPTDTEKVYLLVENEAESQLIQAVQDLQQSCQHWSVVLGERLPPYEFSQTALAPGS